MITRINLVFATFYYSFYDIPTGKKENTNEQFCQKSDETVEPIYNKSVVTIKTYEVTTLLYLFGGVNLYCNFNIRFKSPSNWKINMYLKSLAGAVLC